MFIVSGEVSNSQFLIYFYFSSVYYTQLIWRVVVSNQIQSICGFQNNQLLFYRQSLRLQSVCAPVRWVNSSLIHSLIHMQNLEYHCNYGNAITWKAVFCKEKSEILPESRRVFSLAIVFRVSLYVQIVYNCKHTIN